MNPDKALKDVKRHVAELEQAASAAERRLAIATNQAKSLEDRNRLAIEAVEAEVADLRAEQLAQAGRQAAELAGQTAKLEAVKAGLLDEIDDLESIRTNRHAELEQLADQQLLLADDVGRAGTNLAGLEAGLSAGRADLASLEAAHAERAGQIAGLDNEILTLKEDIEALSAEAVRLEDRIIDQDAVFKDRQAVIAGQLAGAESKLKIVSDRLLEAEKRDKTIRASWAEGQLALEKRERVVRKRELLVADSDARAAVQDDFMKL